MEINIEEMNKTISQGLTELENNTLQKCRVNPGVSCTYDIDGEKNITSISFWSNGLCDVESIEIKTEERTFRHYEFQTLKEAETTLINEIKLAISHA